jgi:hypothetical protein
LKVHGLQIGALAGDLTGPASRGVEQDGKRAPKLGGVELGHLRFQHGLKPLQALVLDRLGTCRPIPAAGVPGRGLYLKA